MEYPQDTTKQTGLLLEQSLIIKKFNQLNNLSRILKTLMVGIEPTTIGGIELNNDMLSLLCKLIGFFEPPQS